jgi:two-component system, cell cycle sensor histidine kinase and response regulator CckA
MPERGEAFRALFSHHPLPMLVFDVDTLGILDVNEAAVRLYGHSRADFLRLTIRDVRPASDVPRLEDALAADEQGLHEAGEWRHRRRDGSLMDVRIVNHSLRYLGRPARLVSVQDITAAKRSDHQRRLLGAALHSAANAILITDRNGIIEWVNPAFTAMTGYSAAEAIGRNPRTLLRSGKHDVTFYEQLWRRIRGGNVWRGRMTNRRKDGSLYPEEQTITPVRGTDGCITHFIAVKEDVTRRLADEDALRRSEERYRSLFHGIPIGLFRATAEGRFVDANQALVVLLGCEDRRALLRRSLQEFFDGPHSRRELLERLEAEGEVRGLDVALRRPDGRRIWARLTMVGERNEQGRVEYLEGALEDVTARRRDEDALRFQGQLLDAVGEAVVATDRGGVIRYWNRHAEDLLGWTAEEALGRDLLALGIPAASRAEAEAGLATVIGGERIALEMDVVRRDGSAVPCHVTGAPVRGEEGRVTGALGVFRDLTERRLLEQQLLQGQRLEAVGRVAGGIAHDFNNILTVIRGHAQFLLEGLPEGELQDDARAVQRSAEAATRLTQQLLAFSRRQVLKPEVLDLGDAVAGMDRLLRSVVGGSVGLTVSAEPGVGRVEIDPDQMQQVLVNLAGNARDAMPDGGSLAISVRAVSHDDFQQQVAGPVDPGPYLLLEVRDTGTGMNPDVLDHLFEPFFTTKAPGQGAGLGLSTVYGIVAQSGGHVAVASAPGHGTAFRVYLPRVVAGRTAPPGQPA